VIAAAGKSGIALIASLRLSIAYAISFNLAYVLVPVILTPFIPPDKELLSVRVNLPVAAKVPLASNLNILSTPLPFFLKAYKP